MRCLPTKKISTFVMVFLNSAQSLHRARGRTFSQPALGWLRLASSLLARAPPRRFHDVGLVNWHPSHESVVALFNFQVPSRWSFTKT